MVRLLSYDSYDSYDSCIFLPFPQSELRTLVAALRPQSAGPTRVAPPTVDVEGWRAFPGLPAGPPLPQREASVRFNLVVLVFSGVQGPARFTPFSVFPGS